MNSVIVSDFGTVLGKTSERLVVRGPRPRLELIEGGSQLFLPMDLPARPPLRILTSNGPKTPATPIRAAKPKDGAPRVPRQRPEQGVRTLVADHVPFETREHRGAPDPVNSALNYGYGILYTQVWGALMNAGLEPFAGFLHVDRPGKPSLVLDLIEEFRQPIVDRAVIAAITKGTKFETREGLLADESRRAVASVALERLEGEVGFRGRRHRVKSVIQIQARNLATSLRGGDPYRPFAFKW